MVKKIISGLVFAILVIGGAFSQEHAMLSFGIGGDIGLEFINIKTNVPQSDISYEYTFKNTVGFRGGFTVFIDTTLFEMDIGIKTYDKTYKLSSGNIYETVNYFNLGLFVKYPFIFNDKVTFFPLLGLNWQIFTSGKTLSGGQSFEIRRADLGETNYCDQFAINLGAGVDYYITSSIFIRGQFVYGLNLKAKYQKDLIEQIKDAGYDLSISQHGPSIRLFLGYNY